MTKLIIVLFLTLAVASAEPSFRGDSVISMIDVATKASSFECFNLSLGLMTPISKLVTDVKEDRRDFHTIKANIVDILSKMYTICDKCDLPRPKAKEGPADKEKCIFDFGVFANMAKNIVEDQKNLFDTVSRITKLADEAPTILMDCGINL